MCNEKTQKKYETQCNNENQIPNIQCDVLKRSVTKDLEQDLKVSLVENQISHSDSEAVDNNIVEFKDNLNLSEGEEYPNEGMLYYPKDDLTNYSKNKGIKDRKSVV